MTIHNPTPAEQGNTPLPDIDLRKLFEEAKRSLPPKGLPTLVNADGVFFLTLSADDRAGIAMTIERLIDMLDVLDADPDFEDGGDLEPNIGWASGDRPARGFIDSDEREADESDCEPSLGAPERHHRSVETIACGVVQPRSGVLRHDCGMGQVGWAAGGSDDREEEDEREDGNDAEYSLGWANEGSQGRLCSHDEREPELGWTEYIDQTVSGRQDETCWLVPDGEGDIAGCDDVLPAVLMRFDGSGVRIAGELLGNAKPRVEPNFAYAEMAHELPEGAILRTFVTSRDGRVARC